MRVLFRLIFFLVIFSAVGVLTYSYITPIHLGYDGEAAVGFYRFHVIEYDVVDYWHRGNVLVRETLGNTIDFLAYLLGLRDFDLR